MLGLATHGSGTIRDRCVRVRPETHPIPGSPMVPAIGARWPPRRGELGMRIKDLGVVARVGIEPTTRGFSVRGRGGTLARKPKKSAASSRSPGPRLQTLERSRCSIRLGGSLRFVPSR